MRICCVVSVSSSRRFPSLDARHQRPGDPRPRLAATLTRGMSAGGLVLDTSELPLSFWFAKRENGTSQLVPLSPSRKKVLLGVLTVVLAH